MRVQDILNEIAAQTPGTRPLTNMIGAMLNRTKIVSLDEDNATMLKFMVVNYVTYRNPNDRVADLREARSIATWLNTLVTS